MEFNGKHLSLEDRKIIENNINKGLSIKVNTKITKKGNIIFTNLGNEILMLSC